PEAVRGMAAAGDLVSASACGSKPSFDKPSFDEPGIGEPGAALAAGVAGCLAAAFPVSRGVGLEASLAVSFEVSLGLAAFLPATD
ncbi:hypothetical protein, partial [Bradyrhizobium sp.]|uniref:hypothetical protein n=1 Tax=Bradyrhizobium sp. TaxID=376 RepID=UPI003C37C063